VYENGSVNKHFMSELKSSSSCSNLTWSGDIHLKDVHFSYPLRSDVEVLNGLDLTIECGKVTALVGPSGAGKSTVVQLLARYYEPTQGCITVAGEDIRIFDKREWSRVVSLVNQVYHYKFPHHLFCFYIHKLLYIWRIETCPFLIVVMIFYIFT